jgi:transposase InsO family protein
MKEIGIKASTVGLYSWQPGRQALYSSAGNILAEAGEAQSPGEQWAGDFTFVRTKAGWLFHAIVMDLYSRKIIGWAFNRKRSAELTKSALTMALNRQQPKPGCVFHSDQGIEYAAHDYRDAVESAGLTRSMSRKGTPLDNARVESFFHSMKTEVIYGKSIENHIEGVARIMEYIDFYNRERLHSSLGYQSPENYEKLCA